MTLISLLLVLAIERVTTKTRVWQAEYYFDHYRQLAEKKHWLNEQSSSWTLYGLILIPTLLLWLALHYIDSGLLQFIISTLVLMVCIGCPSIRAAYRCYLQAGNRGDLEACDLYAQQLDPNARGVHAFALNLVWKNYRHYAAVLLWYVVFGAPGVVLYTLGREFQEHFSKTDHPLLAQANSLMAILDWVPVRVTALGLMLVGHYSRALPVWLSYLPDTSVSAKTVIEDVAQAAEEIEVDEGDCTTEACTLVRLAKRNMLFLLVVVSVLTLGGLVN